MRYESVCETNDGIAGKNLCLTSLFHLRIDEISIEHVCIVNRYLNRSRVSRVLIRFKRDRASRPLVIASMATIWMRRRIGMRSWRGGAKIFHRLTEFRVIFYTSNDGRKEQRQVRAFIFSRCNSTTTEDPKVWNTSNVAEARVDTTS